MAYWLLGSAARVFGIVVFSGLAGEACYGIAIASQRGRLGYGNHQISIVSRVQAAEPTHGTRQNQVVGIGSQGTGKEG